MHVNSSGKFGNAERIFSYCLLNVEFQGYLEFVSANASKSKKFIPHTCDSSVFDFENQNII